MLLYSLEILKMIIRQTLHEKTWNVKTQGSMYFSQENDEPQRGIYLSMKYEEHKNLKYSIALDWN